MPQEQTVGVFDTQLFRVAFNASPIGIVVESLDGQPFFVNPAFCSFLGFSEEELRGKHCVDFSPPEDAEKDWKLFQQLRAGSIDHYQLEKRYFRRDGSLVWGSLSISLWDSHPSPLVIAMVEDITDKKKAEEALFRHAAIVESSEDAISSVTLDGVIETWNAGAQRMFGYTENEAVGKPVTIVVPPELPDEENKILETLRAGGRIEQFETVRVTKTGKRIDVSLSISPIKDSTGKIVGCAGIARDISDRKRDEEVLRASEERLRLSQQAAHIGTFEWNIRTGVNSWTPELEAMYGLPLGGFGGTQTAFENLVHSDDRARVIGLVDSALKSGQPMRGEWRVVWPDGSVHWIAGRWQVFTNESGEPSRMIGVNGDITERKLAEEARFRLAAIVESSDDAIVSKNLDGTIISWNAGAQKIYGYTEAEALGKPISILVPPELADEKEEILARLRAGQRIEHYETVRVHKTGKRINVSLSSFPIKDSSGMVQSLSGIARDITQQKKAEQALAEMTRKLVAAQEQERTRIGRELHDDITQRLAMLSVELERLQQSPAELQSHVQELRKELRQISDDVQAMSHDLHSSKLEYLGAVPGMKSWCKEIADRCQIEVAFRSDFSGYLPLDVGLPLFRVLQEVVNNSIKHSGAKQIKVELSEDSGEIHLILSDSGKGFDVETALRGKGLGLTSMKERVRLVNGTIAIESTPKGGTNIHVRVPLEGRSSPKRLSA
jgi:PAS domain S-box-containing protein